MTTTTTQASIIRINEADLYAIGFDRVFVNAMRHIVRTVGTVTEQATVPAIDDRVSTNSVELAFSDDAAGLAELRKSLEDVRAQIVDAPAWLAELAKAIEDQRQKIDSDLPSIAEIKKRIDDLEIQITMINVPVIPSVGPFIAPTLLNSWVNYGAPFNSVGYCKDQNGIVRLRGTVKSGVVGTAIFTLPAGFIPANSELISTASNGALGIALIDNTGNVLTNTGSNAYFSIDNITFRAA